MYKVINSTQATKRQITSNKLARNYITKNIDPNLSLATLEASNYDEEETTKYTRIYYVLEGSLELIVGNEASTLQKNDTIYIEKNTTYKMKGTFKAIVINEPAFGTL